MLLAAVLGTAAVAVAATACHVSRQKGDYVFQSEDIQHIGVDDPTIKYGNGQPPENMLIILILFSSSATCPKAPRS